MSDLSDRIILSVKLASGQFDTSLSISVNCSPEERTDAIMRWLELVQMGLKLKVVDLRADLEVK